MKHEPRFNCYLLFPTGSSDPWWGIIKLLMSVRPSGVISQRWLDGCFWNHNMLFPSTLGWCPSLRNFKILKNGRLTVVLLKSYTTYNKKALDGYHGYSTVVKHHLLALDDSPHSIWRHCSILLILLINSQTDTNLWNAFHLFGFLWCFRY